MKRNRICRNVGQLLLTAAVLIALAPGIRAAETESSPPEEPEREEQVTDRVLNIYQSASGEAEKQPLADIQIDLYLVAAMEELAGELSLSEQPTQQEIERYQRPENLIATLLTDVQGFATYNFTENGRPDGVYLVVERFSPSIAEAIEPFYISIPTTGEEGGQYTLDIHLKSTVESGPVVNIDVNAIDNDSGSFAVGQLHTWIIRGSLPKGLGKAQSYILTHEIDSRLTRENGSMVILHTRDGGQIPLRSKEHYQLEEGRGIDGIDRLRLALTPAGMAYAASNLGEGSYTPELRISFRACINGHTAMGETIPGSAQLSYTNSAGISFEVESDKPEVHTGGIHIALTDGIQTPLPEASFRLARLATDGELLDRSIRKDQLYIDGQKQQVVFASFYDNEAIHGEMVTEMTTKSDGKSLAYGLPYGKYYLVETKAPSGYNRITLPIPVAVNEISHLTEDDGWKNMKDEVVDNTVTITNTKFVLPETGGVGTALFAMVGISMTGAACMSMVRCRRKAVK